MKEPRPLLSVLIPAYNAGSYFEEMIESVLSQTYRPLQILIADDKSTDNTRLLIDKYAAADTRIETFHNDQNLGKPKTCEKLIQHIKGEFFTIHDADDSSDLERFSIIIDKMLESPNIGMCGSVIQRMTEQSEKLPLFRDKVQSFERIKENMLKANTDADASVVIRTEVLQSVGGLYRTYFRSNMDYDFGLRVLEKYEITNVLKPLYFYRNTPNSISKDIKVLKKIYSDKMARFFAEERSQGKKDAIERNDTEVISAQEAIFEAPYRKDKALFYREKAASFMYYEMYKSAIEAATIAVGKEFSLRNIRTLLYCFRVSFIKKYFKK